MESIKKENLLKLLGETPESLKEYNVPVQNIFEQIETLRKGIPPVTLHEPCTVGNGIIKIADGDFKKYINFYQKAANENRFTKFVPASGAATRMFRKIQTILNYKDKATISRITSLADKGDESAKYGLEFLKERKKFAFYDDIKTVLKRDGFDIEKLIDEGNCYEIFDYTVNGKGLNYAHLPKGSIKFHKYGSYSRTAFEEHLTEAASYAINGNRSAAVHFTISPEHEDDVYHLFDGFKSKYDRENLKINVSFSFQKHSTNTIAVTLDNKPVRDKKNKLVFRPGGHGALLENLNDLDGDIVFIKNIDNIVHESFREMTILYKKILAGLLVELQSKSFNYLTEMEAGISTDERLSELENFARNWFAINLPGTSSINKIDERKEYLFNELNRPIRVCGMVKNEGHPGGGPFWVKDKKGKITLQIVESAQIDSTDPSQLAIFNSAEYFNPVDLVCGLKNHKGENFNLFNYRKPDTGLITIKSFEGKDLKALELPGLWNGGMAYWNTVFVEVPEITFNPVKEVNDLLKREHQPPS